MTNSSDQKKLPAALRRLFCFSLLCALPADSFAQEQQKTQVRQTSARSVSRASGQDTAGQNSSGPQWMKSAHRGWVAVPTGAKPAASIRLASLKAQENPAGSSADTSPAAAPAATPAAPLAVSESPSSPADASNEKSAPASTDSSAELTTPQDATPPAGASPSVAPPSSATPPVSGLSPRMSRESLEAIREKMKQSILNRQENRPVETAPLSPRDVRGESPATGLSDLLMDDLKSDDEIRRQRAQEFRKVQERLKLLLEQEKQRKAQQAKLAQPAVAPPEQIPVTPEKSSLTPDPHPAPDPLHPETPHPTPDSTQPHTEPVKPGPDAGPQHPTSDPNHRQGPGSLTLHPDDGPHHDDHKGNEGHETDHGHDLHQEAGQQPAKTTVDGTIDHLGLANNLFAVGQFELSLEIYQKIDLSTVSPQQQFWVEYQQASCLRRLGRSAEASNRYRRLADKPEAGSLSELARWWVTTLEHKRQLEKKLAEKPGQSTDDDHTPTDQSADAHAPGLPLKSTPREQAVSPKASSDSRHSSGHEEHHDGESR